MRSGPLSLLPLVLFAVGCSACSGAPPPPVAPMASAAPAVSAAPASSAARAGAPPLTAAGMDGMIHAAWDKAGLTPAPRVDDARFLRRVYLDILGVIPPIDAVSAFLADAAPDKRRKVIDALLASPRYADHWTDVWDRVLLGRDVRRNVVDRDTFRAWLHDELAANVGYDKLVFSLITATGQSDAKESGAVNFLVRFQDTPQDLAGNASKLFLGVQIQCAECHDHKTEAWKTEDFRRFAACFAKTKSEQVEPMGDAMAAGKRKRFEVKDTAEISLKKRKEPEIKAIAAAAPTALDGTDFSKSDNRRKALGAWMTAPENPWFAQAAVNRIWAHFLGRGFVDPVTDFRPSNPPAVPELLKAMAADFISTGYDVKHLIQQICATEVYQRTAAKVSGPEADRLWARFRVEPLGPDELLDSVIAATKLDAVTEQKRGEQGILEMRQRFDKQVTFLFDVDEDLDDPDYDGSIPQALFMLNGGFLQNAVRAVPGSALAEVMALPGADEEKIKSLYLRTLTREPDAAEIAAAVALLAAPAAPAADEAAPPEPGKRKGKGRGKGAQGRDNQESKGKRAAYEDLFWALLNASEFALNH